MNTPGNEPPVTTGDSRPRFGGAFMFRKKLSNIVFNMPRGSLTLFNEIFVSAPALKSRKGRSEDCNALRNKCIIERYWYFGANTGFAYPILLKIISAQFFITERTVHNVISENIGLLHQVRTSKPTKRELEKKWPHLSWENPELKFYI